MDFGHLEFSGLAHPSGVIDVPLVGSDGAPISHGSEPFTLKIHAAGSPGSQNVANLVAAMLGEARNAAADPAQDPAARAAKMTQNDIETLGQIITDWSLPEVPYTPEALNGLIAQHPMLFGPIFTCVMGAFQRSKNTTAASSSGRRKKATSPKTDAKPRPAKPA